MVEEDPGKRTTPAANPPPKDSWSKALDSLESEFLTPPPAPKTEAPVPPPPSAAAGSARDAFLAAPDLELEVARLREELEMQQAALDMYERMHGEEAPPPSGAAAPPEDGEKVRRLEESLSSARMEILQRERAVQELREQLGTTQEQLHDTLGAIVSPGEALLSRARGPTPAPEVEARKVIRRHLLTPSEEAVGAGLLVPIEIHGPDDEIGQTVLFAQGEGEALELFLSTLINLWKGLGRRFDFNLGPDGFHIRVVDDPENRRLSVLTSGTCVVHLGEAEIIPVRSLLSPPARARPVPREGT